MWTSITFAVEILIDPTLNHRKTILMSKSFEKEKLQVVAFNSLASPDSKSFQVQFSNKTQMQITDLQWSYLQFLAQGNSIYQLFHHFMQNGWLIDFEALEQLLLLMLQKQSILSMPLLEAFRWRYAHGSPQQNKTVIAATTTHAQSMSTSQIDLFPFLRSLGPPLKESFLNNIKKIRIEAGSQILQRGEQTRDLYFLLSGQVAAYNEGRLLSVLEVGSVFGELGFFLGRPRSADIIALKATELGKVSFDPRIFDFKLNQNEFEGLSYRLWVMDAIASSPLFGRLPPESLEKLIFSGRRRDFNMGDCLMREGDPADRFYVVLRGDLSIQQGNSLMKPQKAPTTLGEVGLMMSGGIRTATVAAQSPVLTQEILAPQFYELLAENFFLGVQIQKLARTRIQNHTY